MSNIKANNHNFNKKEIKRIKEIRKTLDVEFNKKNEDDIDMEVVRHCLQEYSEYDNTPAPDFSVIKAAIIARANQSEKPIRKIMKNTLKLKLIAAVCVLLVFICIPITAYGFGIDIFSEIGKWSKETIEYLDKAIFKKGNLEGITTSDVKHYETTEAAMENENMKAKIIGLLPSGFELDDIFCSDYGEYKSLTIIYKNNDKKLFYTISTKIESFEQIKKATEKYLVGEQDYYIVQIDKQWMCYWVENGLLCSISGDFFKDKEEFLKIVDSLR